MVAGLLVHPSLFCLELLLLESASWEDCSCAVHLLSQPGRHALVGGLSGVDGVHSPGLEHLLCGRSGGTVQSYISTPGVQACVEKKSNISSKLNILHYCECKKLFFRSSFFKTLLGALSKIRKLNYSYFKNGTRYQRNSNCFELKRVLAMHCKKLTMFVQQINVHC